MRRGAAQLLPSAVAVWSSSAYDLALGKHAPALKAGGSAGADAGDRARRRPGSFLRRPQPAAARGAAAAHAGAAHAGKPSGRLWAATACSATAELDHRLGGTSVHQAHTQQGHCGACQGCGAQPLLCCRCRTLCTPAAGRPPSQPWPGGGLRRRRRALTLRCAAVRGGVPLMSPPLGSLVGPAAPCASTSTCTCLRRAASTLQLHMRSRVWPKLHGAFSTVYRCLAAMGQTLQAVSMLEFTRCTLLQRVSRAGSWQHCRLRCPSRAHASSCPEPCKDTEQP